MTMGETKGMLWPQLSSVCWVWLTRNIKTANIDVQYGNDILAILLYANDIVIMTETEKDLQLLMDMTDPWHLQINPD